MSSNQLSSKHCHKCTKEFSCKRAADVHSAKCNGLLTHQCGRCLLVYPTLYAYKNHECHEQEYRGEYPNRAHVFSQAHPRVMPVQALQPLSTLGFLSPEAFALIKAYILANPERFVAAYELDVENCDSGHVLQELVAVTFFTGPMETRSLRKFQYSNTIVVDSGVEVAIMRSNAVELTVQFCKELGSDRDIVAAIARRDIDTIILQPRDAKKFREKSVVAIVMQSQGQVLDRAEVTTRVQGSKVDA